ncbi:hypothetical protein JOC48_002765 [Aquibacillus albus]|uniref:Uncharacterized protein n=1 Tax=Aquibacillus albus TaxID=1168171 RepID=A0ABS2N2A7_9BACI|nr:hypothetical protein [Aquibacillus albus]
MGKRKSSPSSEATKFRYLVASVAYYGRYSQKYTSMS